MRSPLRSHRRSAWPLLLELDLSRGVVETPATSSLRAVGARAVPSLHALLDALRQAERDRHVAGLVAHVGQRPLSLAQSSELRNAVARFCRSGRVAVAWTESFGELGAGNAGYHLATAFEEIWLQPMRSPRWACRPPRASSRCRSCGSSREASPGAPGPVSDTTSVKCTTAHQLGHDRSTAEVRLRWGRSAPRRGVRRPLRSRPECRGRMR